MILLLTGLAFAADDPFALRTTIEVLPNGLKVIVVEDHRTDKVALHIGYGVGSRDERDGERGCAHLFEHLMFEGSRNVPNNAFDEWLTAVGGDNNAWTSEDRTSYHMTFPSGALDLALFLESDRLAFLDAGLVQENLANQQKIVLQERAEGYAEPNGRDWDSMSRIAWPADHPYHHPVIGTVADIEGFSLEAVQGFWDRHYRTRNATLALVGNVDTAAALERVRWWFSDVPDKGAPTEREQGPRPGGVQGVAGVVEDDVEERTMYLAWETVPLRDPDEPALDLLSLVLSNGRGTRLDDAMYYESKLSSGVGAWSSMSDLSGQMVFYASSPDKPLSKLQKAIDKQIAAIAKAPPTAAELDRARRALRGRILDALENPEVLADQLVGCQMLWGKPDCLADDWARYQAVTPADLQRVANKYLVERRPVTLSNVPRGQAATALAGAAPVELP